MLNFNRKYVIDYKLGIVKELQKQLFYDMREFFYRKEKKYSQRY